MEVKNLDQAVQAILASKRETLSEEYKTQLDEFISRTTNPEHIVKLLNEEDLSKALDDRATKRASNLKYQKKREENENTYPNLFKKNFDVDLSGAEFDDLKAIRSLLTTKIAKIDELLQSKKASKIAELKAQLAELEN